MPSSPNKIQGLDAVKYLNAVLALVLRKDIGIAWSLFAALALPVSMSTTTMTTTTIISASLLLGNPIRDSLLRRKIQRGTDFIQPPSIRPTS